MGVWGLVLTTAQSEAEAGAIAAALIDAKLAACVSLFPIKSVYMWEDRVQNESEWQLLIKTRLDQFDALSRKVKSLHSYDVPELIAVPIENGSADYLSWMGTQISSRSA
ncbi:MAG: divalent-cation tolerance protein CutA [Cyanobacteria bacterium J06614_10]